MKKTIPIIALAMMISGSVIATIPQDDFVKKYESLFNEVLPLGVWSLITVGNSQCTDMPTPCWDDNKKHVHDNNNNELCTRSCSGFGSCSGHGTGGGGGGGGTGGC